jgi:hypothetical protein
MFPLLIRRHPPRLRNNTFLICHVTPASTTGVFYLCMAERNTLITGVVCGRTPRQM